MKLNGQITEKEVRDLIRNYLISKDIVPISLEPFIDYQDNYDGPIFSGYKFEIEK